MGERELDINFLNNYDSLNPINFKYTSDYLGFTENHFFNDPADEQY
jgi:hypothetical protein